MIIYQIHAIRYIMRHIFILYLFDIINADIHTILGTEEILYDIFSNIQMLLSYLVICPSKAYFSV